SEEHRARPESYLVLRLDCCSRHLNSDSCFLGTTVDVNEHRFTVFGVVPAAFHGADLFLWPDFWMPMVDSPDDEGANLLSIRGMHNIWFLGKLKPDVTRAQATDNLNGIASELPRQNPDDDALSARLAKPGLIADRF